MKKRHRNNKSAQTVLEYIIVIMIVVLAFSALATKLRQKTQASYKDAADTFGEGRQFHGSLSTPPALPEYVFPVLPGGTHDTVGPPPGGGGVCDPSELEDLAKFVLKLEQDANELQLAAAEKRKAAIEAAKTATEAEIVAAAKQHEADIAKDAADAAWREANAKLAAYNSCVAGNEGCTTNCADCNPFYNAYLSAAAEARAKQDIADALAAEAARLAAEAMRLRAIASALDAEATKAEEKADKAAQVAVEESEKLDARLAECYSQNSS